MGLIYWETLLIREIYSEEKELHEFDTRKTFWRQEGQMEIEIILRNEHVHIDSRTGDAKECNGIDNAESYCCGFWDEILSPTNDKRRNEI